MQDPVRFYGAVPSAAEGAAALGERALPLTGQIISLLAHQEPLFRCAAVNAIAQIGPPKRREFIIQAASDPSWLVRQRAIYSLDERDWSEPSVAQVLRSGLRDSAWDVRFAAAEQIRRMGPPAAALLPDLHATLESESDARVLKKLQQVVQQITRAAGKTSDH